MHVVAVHARGGHSFSKDTVRTVELIAGHGVRGDGHCGVTVQHRSRAAKDPTQPNLRQVHLMHAELFAELEGLGFSVSPGQMGENVTTSGIDLLGLSVGTELRLGSDAVVRLTGLRNPCSQIEAFQPGLLAAVLGRNADGELVRKTGVMAIVVTGGIVRGGDPVTIASVPEHHVPLEPV